MSFPRAVIKRFNEITDTTIPAPGTYDPKFVTDVAVASTLKGKSSRNNLNVKTRPEDDDPSSQAQPSARIIRRPSITRRGSGSSTAQPNDVGKRDASVPQNNTPTPKPKIKTRSSSVSGTHEKRSLAPSRRTSSSPMRPQQPTPEVKVTLSESRTKPDQSKKSTHKIPQDGVLCQEFMTSIQEIQNLAESLQVEVSEYKRRLTSELIRNQELEAKKYELEFVIQSLRRELGKYESAKEAWLLGEKSHRDTVQQFLLSKTEMEQEMSNLVKKCDGYKDKEVKLKERIEGLEGEKLIWHAERDELNGRIQKTQKTLQEHESTIADLERKRKELVSQMDSCYHMCESRMADAENTKEIFEVKVLELTQDKEALQKELDNMRRELETEKTLMELMKSEQTGSSSNVNQNYIS